MVGCQSKFLPIDPLYAVHQIEMPIFTDEGHLVLACEGCDLHVVRGDGKAWSALPRRGDESGCPLGERGTNRGVIDLELQEERLDPIF